MSSAFPQGFFLLRKSATVGSENAVFDQKKQLEEDREETRRVLIEMMTLQAELKSFSYSFSMSFSMGKEGTVDDDDDDGDESDHGTATSVLDGNGGSDSAPTSEGNDQKTTALADEEESNKNLDDGASSEDNLRENNSDDGPSSAVIAVSVLIGVAMGIAAFVFVAKRVLRPSRAALSLSSDDGSASFVP